MFRFAQVINDIVASVLNGVRCSLYVDDFILYLSSSHMPTTLSRMQLAINRVVDVGSIVEFRADQSGKALLR